MLRLTCPFCGERNHDEFTYLEDATPKPKFDNARMSDWLDAIYWRVNPKGKHQELWHHVGGCRMILRVERDTVTHEIFKIEPAASRHEFYVRAI